MTATGTTNVARLDWTPRERLPVPNGRWGALHEERLGVMVHFDGSGSDAGAVAWFADARCAVSYQLLVLDDGSFVRIAPDDHRAWHAGHCRTSDPERLPYKDANSAFFGVAVATTDGVDVTALQTLTVAYLVWRYFVEHGWPLEETWRIVGHSSEAVYPTGHAKAGQRGRKTDPEGTAPKNPILAVEDVRKLVRLYR